MVADDAPMLMESVTVLLNRLGVAYVAIMSPVFRVRRSPDGALEEIPRRLDDGAKSADGIDESWIHVELAAGADRDALTGGRTPVAAVVTDAQRVARDTEAMRDALHKLADAMDNDAYGRFPAADSATRWRGCCAGWTTATSCCWATSAARCRTGEAEVDDSSRLGVLRRRQDVFPQLTESDDLFVLTQATSAQLPALRRVPLCRRGA